MGPEKNKKTAGLLFFLVIFISLIIVGKVNAAPGDLIRITDDTKVSNSTSAGFTWSRQTAVAYLNNGNYVVAWIDNYNDEDGVTPNAVLFQFLDSTGEKVGSVIDTGMTRDNDNPVGVAEVQGGFVVASNLNYRIFDTNGLALTGVLSWGREFDRTWFGMKKGIGGDFAISYRADSLPYLETFDNGGNSTGSLALLTDHETGQPNFITLQDGSGYLAIWSENQELHGQFVTDDLALSGSDFRIDQADTPMLSRESEYELVQNSEGNILVTWYDARVQQNDRYPDKVYGRLMDSTGTFLTNEFVIASDLIEPSFIGQDGSQLRPYAPPGMAVLEDKFVVVWLEKDGVNQNNLGAHIKGILIDGAGSLVGSVFKMETNENTVNPTRRAMFPNLASNGTDNLAMAWVDGRNSYTIIEGEQQRLGTEIMANFWEIESADEDVPEEEFQKAHVDSWKAYQYDDPGSNLCTKKLRLEIKGKHFDSDAEVKIGNNEAFSVKRISSKKLVAKFCLDKLLDNQKSRKRNVWVINSGADEEKADKEINLNDLGFLLSESDFNTQTIEGIKNIQKALVQLGYLDSQYVTGFYGPITTEAVRKFQADNGLMQTGYVGPLTKAKLEEKTI
jgi:hypothetical protein